MLQVIQEQKKICRTFFEITQMRVYELRESLARIERDYGSSKTTFFSRSLKNHIEWTKKTLELNEALYERLSEMECNKIH